MHLTYLWFQQHAGRVTASKLKTAVCTNMSQPSLSLIRSVCYLESNYFKSKATSWRCDHEKIAIEEYASQEKSKHKKFRISDSGLVIRPSHLFMGSSPDSFIECECCEWGDGSHLPIFSQTEIN